MADPTGLVYLRARQYDPATGRMLAIDPAQQPNGSAGSSPYIYAADNPVAFDDPSGATFEPTNRGIGSASLAATRALSNYAGQDPVTRPMGLGWGLAFLFALGADQCIKSGACNSGNAIIIKKLGNLINQAKGDEQGGHAKGESEPIKAAARKHGIPAWELGDEVEAEKAARGIPGSAKLSYRDIDKLAKELAKNKWKKQ